LPALLQKVVEKVIIDERQSSDSTAEKLRLAEQENLKKDK